MDIEQWNALYAGCVIWALLVDAQSCRTWQSGRCNVNPPASLAGYLGVSMDEYHVFTETTMTVVYAPTVGAIRELIPNATAIYLVMHGQPVIIKENNNA